MPPIPPTAVKRATTWLKARLAETGPEMRLAIGGPRESEAPGICARAKAVINAVLNTQRLLGNAPAPGDE